MMVDDKPPGPRRNRPGKRPLKTGQMVRLLIVIVLIAAAALWFGQWLWHRHTHVVEDNASVETDMVTVSSRLQGRIDTFAIEVGDQLTRGDTIARLYDRPLRLELARRQQQVARMEARLSFEEHQISLAEQQLEGGIANARRQLETDRAALALAETELEDTRHTWERSERLYESNNISAQQKDQDYFNLQSARARLEQTRRQVEQRRTELANADQGLLSGAPMTLPTPDLLRAKISITRQELEEARAAVEQQRGELADMEVTSPSDGVVSRTFVEPGEHLSAGQPILMMHQPDNVWIEAKVKETSISELAEGQSVAIDVDAYPDRSFRGRVAVIGPAATSQFALIPSSNPSGNFTKITQRIPVRIDIEEGQRRLLRPGMMVVVTIDATAD